MKRLIFSILLFNFILTSAQTNDDFSENSLTNYSGTTDKFVIKEGRLQLNDESASGTQQAYLATTSEAIENASWSISVQLKFNPSSSNYARFYLVSDKEDFTADLNGYFVMIGNTADEVSLYKQSGSTKTQIINGTDKRLDASTVDVSVKVTRDQDGNWHLYSKLPSEQNFYDEGTCTDNTYTTAKFSGMLTNYTSSNGQKISFDDLNISGEKATPKYNAKLGDIAFNELMVKPSPRVSLPEEEYIEIINLASEKIDLTGFSLCETGKKYNFPNAALAPNEIALLCTQKNAESFSKYGKIVPFSSLPNLVDSGKLLWIENSQNDIICWVEYSDAWNTIAFKQNGGWSLECIDATNNSNLKNWTVSTNKNGGTPAQTNSVVTSNPDTENPEISSFKILSINSIEITFSEMMNPEKLSDVASYQLSKEKEIASCETSFPKMNGVVLTLNEQLSANEKITLSMPNLTDFAGNKLSGATIEFSGIATAENDDLLINEFLFGQKNDGNFIELLNSSEKILDLSDIYLCSRKDNELTSGTLLANEQTLIYPNEYIVLTTSKNNLCAQYSCAENARYITLKSLSEFSINGGNIVLVRRNGDVIDEVIYSAENCASMTSKTEICSAERTEEDTWQICSTIATIGKENSLPKTIETLELDKPEPIEIPTGISLAEKSFSPNGDGYRDELKINCRLDEKTAFIKIDIYTAQGALVKHLTGKTEISEPAVFVWNGTDDNGTLCNIGMYLAYVEVQTAKRGIKHYKLPFAITKD